MAGRPQADSVTSQALRRIRGWGRGRVFVPRDLLDLGSRQAIDVSLHRLATAGVVRRLARGIYDYPKVHDRLGPLSPALDDIAMAVTRSNASHLVHSGAATANTLGLSTQVPARPVYLTNGPSRTVRVGNRVIRFAHTSPSRLVGGDTMAGQALRALRYLGRDNITDATVEHVRALLDEADCGTLVGLRSSAPAWMQPIVDRIAGAEPFQAA